MIELEETPLVTCHLGSPREGCDSLWWKSVSETALLCGSHSKLDVKALRFAAQFEAGGGKYTDCWAK